MPRLLLTLLLATATAAQTPAPPDASPAMQVFADAVTALEEPNVRRDPARRHGAIAALRGAAVELAARPAAWAEPELAHAALAELTSVADALAQPPADGDARDEFDLARLRRTCSNCHLHNRDGNDGRGWFPNRGNLVTGSVRVQQQDGSPRPTFDGVVLFVEGGPKAPPQPRARSISQRNRRFDPAVLVVTTGTPVAFPNDDVVFHNVFSRSRSKPFDLGTYRQGDSRHLVFDTAGLVRVHCNIHPDMSAHVLVLETAWHTISDARGRFAITDVPNGDYTLRIWHPLADEQRQTLRLDGGRNTRLDLVVRETKPRVQHLDKNGRPYAEKY
jgi:hypothetical protein